MTTMPRGFPVGIALPTKRPVLPLGKLPEYDDLLAQLLAE